MPRRGVDVGKLRREQVVDAAVAIIAERGLQELSLSAIEERAGMSRGQLTYYFPTKEAILLAVFDRLLELMHRRARGEGGEGPAWVTCGTGWERVRGLLTFLILQPPGMCDFHSLQYTFLSQIGHREDFRRRLASLYEEWRGHMAQDLAEELARRGRRGRPSPRTLATFVQALLHGLAMQRAADPDAYDREEMLGLCLDVLGGCLGPAGPANGHALPPRAPRRRAAAGTRRHPKPPQVNHE
jgi:AcrR family transcriptional regulator